MTIEVIVQHNTLGYNKNIVVTKGGKQQAISAGESANFTVWQGEALHIREAGDSYFKFALRQVVKISETGETGTVHARSESTSGEPQYLVRYKAADGRATEQWWSENALEAF